MWSQIYDPFGNALLSTLAAALPIVVLLGGIGLLRLEAHVAALLGLLSSLLVAILAFRMPPTMAAAAAVAGAAYGLLPIGWIVLNVIFLYQLTLEKGSFGVLQESIASLTPDRRLQLVLIAFSLGAFFEGAAGFGTPVAVTGAMLIGIGFRPLQASGLSLIANTAPVAYGALGTPIIALSTVTGLDLHALSGMVGRQLPLFSVIVPFWLIWSFAGFRGMLQVWPALLVAGVAFAVPQYLVSNFHGPWLVDVAGALSSLAALALFLRVWQPREIWRSLSRGEKHARRGQGLRGEEGGVALNTARLLIQASRRAPAIHLPARLTGRIDDITAGVGDERERAHAFATSSIGTIAASLELRSVSEVLTLRTCGAAVSSDTKA